MTGAVILAAAFAVAILGPVALAAYANRWPAQTPRQPVRQPVRQPLHPDHWLPESTGWAGLEPHVAATGKRIAADKVERFAREIRDLDWTTYDRLKHAAHLARTESQQLEETR